MCDASPDVKVACYAVDLDDAKSLVGRQVVKGIYFIPEDFATRLNRMEQSTISVYCDMALMLTYKAVYQTALAVTTEMGVEIKKHLLGNYTARDDLISTSPLHVEEVSIFNPSGGYGSSVLPAVLFLIIQQTLALGVGMAAGTARERSRYSDVVPVQRQVVVLSDDLCRDVYLSGDRRSEDVQLHPYCHLAEYAGVADTLSAGVCSLCPDRILSGALS